MLKVEKGGFQFPNAKHLFSGLNFEIHAGEIVQVCGPNGAGKTTLLRCLAGLERLSEGQIHWQGPASCTFLPQIAAKSFHIDLSFKDILQSSLGIQFSEDLILRLGLLNAPDLRLEWNNASGGERQKLLLVRTLLSDERLVLLDEPLNHMDQATASQVPRAIEALLQRRPEKAVILVSHQDGEWAAIRQIHLQEPRNG